LNMTDVNLDMLTREILREYESDKLNFSFFERAKKQNVYVNVKARLQALGDLSESTDINEDVSYFYTLTIDNREWVIQLSMVGPYALF